MGDQPRISPTSQGTTPPRLPCRRFPSGPPACCCEADTTQGWPQERLARKGGALGTTASRSEELTEEGEYGIGCCGECLDGAVSHSSGLVRLSDNEIEGECEKDEPR
jgi:hypothetical protein